MSFISHLLLVLILLHLYCCFFGRSLFIGEATLNAAQNLSVRVEIDADTVDIYLTGPASFFFGVGFGGNNIMQNRYAILVSGSTSTTISEHSLDKEDPTQATTQLTSMLTIESITVTDSVRSIHVSRARVKLTPDHNTFQYSAYSFIAIYAWGNTSSIGYHGSNKGPQPVDVVLGTRAPTVHPTAVPTAMPSDSTTMMPTAMPSGQTTFPTDMPTTMPLTSMPSSPTFTPITSMPTLMPSTSMPSTNTNTNDGDGDSQSKAAMYQHMMISLSLLLVLFLPMAMF